MTAREQEKVGELSFMYPSLLRGGGMGNIAGNFTPFHLEGTIWNVLSVWVFGRAYRRPISQSSSDAERDQQSVW